MWGCRTSGGAGYVMLSLSMSVEEGRMVLVLLFLLPRLTLLSAQSELNMRIIINEIFSYQKFHNIGSTCWEKCKENQGNKVWLKHNERLFIFELLRKFSCFLLVKSWFTVGVTSRAGRLSVRSPLWSPTPPSSSTTCTTGHQCYYEAGGWRTIVSEMIIGVSIKLWKFLKYM